MEFGVCYPLANGHCEFVMSALEKQRQDGSLCDIALQVGNQKINAHRCVLAVCSDYFSALFGGSYFERDSKLIDLSETFRSAEALERIIVSMYRGTLEIKKSDDVCDLLETCSILLFDDAKKQCVDCLKSTLCLRNGLKFWFAANNYLDDKHKKRFKSIVDNHFHDYYINQPEMINLSAQDLCVLFQQMFHKFCTPLQLLDFLLRWYAAGETEEDLGRLIQQALPENLAAENEDAKIFLSSPELLSKELGLSLEKCQKFCSLVGTVLGGEKIASAPLAGSQCFANGAERVVNSQECGDTKRQAFGLRTMHSDILLKDMKEDSDIMAVLVLAPTPHILEQRFHLYVCFNHTMTQQFHPGDTLPLFHVSAYIPQKRTWFQLGQILSPAGLTGDKLTRFFDGSLMELCNGHIYVIGDSGENNMRCNLTTFQWSSLPPLKPFNTSLRLPRKAPVNIRPGRRDRVQIVQPIATSTTFFAAVASQQDEVVRLGLMQLVDAGPDALSQTHWTERVPCDIPPAPWGFTLLTAYHCVREDRYIYVVVIGRMHSVHCRATCLAKFDLHLDTVEFLNVPEEYLMEPYHWTLFEQKGSLYMAHKTTFLYKLDLRVEEATWTNCSELITIKGDFKLPSLYAKSWGKFRRLNGVSASEDSMWVMVEKRLVDRWHSIMLWEVQVDMESQDEQQKVKRHVPSPYSCFSLVAHVKLPLERLKGTELCQCVHAE
ncbi:uncharacterized protein LOC135479589 [Liolophura sinensis]|uniref:uncharacterized protein LOC135479589 n=1 Tax=Liolophura sinensis TaxID=3198878 RepID=UPI0031589B53